MKRTYFVLPNLLKTKKAYDDLLNEGVPEDAIHVLTKDEKGLSYFSNHKLSLFTYSDLFPSLVKGTFLGAILGALFYGFLVYGFHEQALTPAETLLWIVFFAVLGGWFSTLVGVSLIKPEFRNLIKKVDCGKGLLAVDELDDPLKHYLLDHYTVERCATL